ncbi:hypothetical protein [Psychrobacter immobilis]|uniref:hypothetical protein n=1 Tax=Psychrobacter immobilis TaxID=498 RepID=UPI001918657B|nr:hypothetical protein [Psychrobacter immobilis]
MNLNNKGNKLKVFALAYLYSYIITFSFVLISEYIYITYDYFFKNSNVSSLFEAYSTIELYYFDAFLSPIALPVMTTIVSSRYPEYFILIIVYGLLLYGIYRVQNVIRKKKILISISLLLILNFVGLKLYPIIVQNMVA